MDTTVELRYNESTYYLDVDIDVLNVYVLNSPIEGRIFWALLVRCRETLLYYYTNKDIYYINVRSSVESNFIGN